jgi:hypothetical protein
MSKGSKPRPVNQEKYNENFDKIFGSKPLSSVSEECVDEREEKKKRKQRQKLPKADA